VPAVPVQCTGGQYRPVAWCSPPQAVWSCLRNEDASGSSDNLQLHLHRYLYRYLAPVAVLKFSTGTLMYLYRYF
jgi:hypothetical protein